MDVELELKLFSYSLDGSVLCWILHESTRTRRGIIRATDFFCYKTIKTVFIYFFFSGFITQFFFVTPALDLTEERKKLDRICFVKVNLK